MELSLSGKTAVVTGGSSGIGAAVVRIAAAAGAKCVAVGRDESRLTRVAAEAQQAGGACTIAVEDLTADGAPERIVQSALAAYGSIDVLVHSAGIFGPKPFLETSLREFDATWRINVRVPFALTQAAVPHMASGSVVIFVSSIDGHVGFASDSAYGPSKSAIDGLTRTLAIELAQQGIRVSAVAPGFTETPMNAPYREAGTLVDSAIRETPAGRLATVDDIAAGVLFLASDAASYTHGTILAVDGGYPTSPLQRGMAPS
jgi:NAD(P)-dependent dehydrogenase (short-subunit alcohol dehydrogenase family)